MKKIKILFIIWSYTMGGGAEKILANVMNHLDPEKYEIDLLEYRNYGIKWEETNDNIHILEPMIFEQKDGIFRKFLCEKFVFHCPKLLRRKYVKKIYDYEISFNYLIPTFLLSEKSKTIAWVHSSIEDLKNNPKLLEKQRRYLRKVQNIVAISDLSFESIVDVFPEFQYKVVMIRNGFDFDMIFSKSKEEISFPYKKPTFLYIGRFNASKGVMRILNVVRILKEQNFEFHFLLLGKGELNSEMETYIRQNKLESYVTILGYIQSPYPYIAKSDVLVHLSSSEGFPTIFVEALCLKKPIVTTVVGGSKELIDGGKNGFEVKTDEECADCLMNLMNDTKLYQKLSRNASKFALQYSIDSQIEALEKLIKR